jgi:hypothetical protein
MSAAVTLDDILAAAHNVRMARLEAETFKATFPLHADNSEYYAPSVASAQHHLHDLILTYARQGDCSNQGA